MKALYNLSKHISIKHKIMISYFCILVTTLVIVLSFSAFTTMRDTKERTLFSITKALGQTKSLLDFKTNSTKNIFDLTSTSTLLQELLQKPKSAYVNDISQWIIDRDLLDSLFIQSKITPDVHSIQLYMETGIASLFSNEDYMPLKNYRESYWYQQVENSTQNLIWLSTESWDKQTSDSYIVALRRIAKLNNLRHTIGILRINIPIESIIENLNEAIISDSSAAFILDSNKIIASSDNINHESLEVQYLINKLNAINSYPFIDRISSNNEYYFIGMDTIQHTNWKLVLLVPNKDLKRIQVKSIKSFFIYLMLVLPLTFPLAYFISNSVTQRISLLIKNIRDIEHENFDAPIAPSSRDEVGVLTQNFNYMTLKISMLLEEKYNLGIENKSLELKALQSQINPHFLYNTLDQIYWLGIRHDIPEVCNIVLALSKFYRLSLSKGEDIVCLDNELKHIESYIYIQNIRFEEGISFLTDIPQKYLDLKLPKITLQPIIENAIHHGILEKDSEKGQIAITLQEEYGYYIIKITDDGVGMTDDEVSHLFDARKKTPHSSGYGLRNIRARLKIMYGDNSDLLIQSSKNEGTTISLVIPFVAD